MPARLSAIVRSKFWELVLALFPDQLLGLARRGHPSPHLGALRPALMGWRFFCNGAIDRPVLDGNEVVAARQRGSLVSSLGIGYVDESCASRGDPPGARIRASHNQVEKVRPEVWPRGAEQVVSWSVRERESTESLLKVIGRASQENVSRFPSPVPLASRRLLRPRCKP